MTVNDNSGMPPEASPNASALVVGIEHYGNTRWDLPGAARLAARFASWLVDYRICLPGRICLMTAYDKEPYQNGTHDSSLSPEELLAALDGLGDSEDTRIHMPGMARADEDFAEWITRYGPRTNDELFVLFWVGHGFAYQGDTDEKVCLLGSDADNYQLRNLELAQLLRAAGSDAPRADVVGFVNTCRAPAGSNLERKLRDGKRPITPRRRADPDRTRNLSVVYAAAHGETTKMAGREDKTFAEVLLELLEDLPVGSGPQAIFDDGLVHIVDELRREQTAPFWTSYGYQHRGERQRYLPPPDEGNLTQEEWASLLAEAAAIDGAPGTDPSPGVLWGAYCHAARPALSDDRPDRPERLESLRDLIWALRDLPPRSSRLAPPLIIACDFVAHLPYADSEPRLAKWCDDWADAEKGRRRRLDLAQKHRPTHLPDRPYLSILVGEDKEPEPGRRGRPARRYRLSAVHWANGVPDLLVRPDPVSENEILAEVEDLISEAGEYGTELDDILVEFVLPRHLLGWRPEYEESLLGQEYAIAIRDLVRLESGAEPARQRAEIILRRIRDFTPDENSRWSERIRWFTCQEDHWPERKQIVATTQNKKYFCIVLGRTNGPASTNSKDSPAPWGLIDSITAGAAIVVSVQQEHHVCDGRYHGRPAPPSDHGSACEMPNGRELITRNVNDGSLWPNGLLDLPYMLRDIRNELADQGEPGSRLQIGVLMEDSNRLWPGYFRLDTGVR